MYMYKLFTFYKKGVKLYRPTEEEVERRRKEYEKVRLEEIAEKILEVPHKKRADGKYDIYGDVILYGMRLTSLLELPIRFGKVYGEFVCSFNALKDLKGAPEYVGNDFSCYGNQLRDLKGAPKYVSGSFACNNNQLISLEGAPEYVGKDFFCSNNQLESLEGAPAYVGGDFVCDDNHLKDLEGAPKYVGGNFFIYNDPKKFTKKEVRKVVEVKGNVYV